MKILETRDFFEGTDPPVVVRTIANHGANPAHTHEFYEMVFILQGFTLHSCGGASSILTSGDIYFLPPGVDHAFIATHETWLYNVLFLPSALNRLGIRVEDTVYSAAARAKADPAQRQMLLPILEQIRHEQETRANGWQRMVMAKFGELLVMFERIHGTTPHLDTSNAHYRQLMKALDFIDGNLERDILLEEIAQASGLSAGNLTRQFKLVTGLSPMEYARSQRMARAAELLKEPDQTVSAVSQKLGFSDISVFSRQFKSLTGMAPTEFRRML